MSVGHPIDRRLDPTPPFRGEFRGGGIVLLLHRPDRDPKTADGSLHRSRRPFGVPLGPYAEELSASLLIQDRRRALAVLMRAIDEDWALPDIEEFVIAAAVTRLGELWLRGRLTDGDFENVGALAERVEVAFRHRLVNRKNPSATSDTSSELLEEAE